jgi:hypothetical protein
MESNQTTDRIAESIIVPADQERAFYAFTQQMTSWWPREYTHSGPLLGHIVLEPHPGATWFEKDQTGQERPPLGSVETWNPPSSVGLTWTFSGESDVEAGPKTGSSVAIRFVPSGENETRVEVEHDGMGLTGTQRMQLSGDEGWRYIFHSFLEYIQQQNQAGVESGGEAGERVA